MDQTPSLSTLAIDGHVHIYKPYDWTDAVSALITNLSAAILSSDSRQHVIIGLLAESKSGQFYKDVISRGSPLTKGSFQLEAGPDADSLLIRESGIIRGYLIAGRQVVTLEKLEVLALGKDVSISNGQPLKATIQAITAQGAVPVLSWSPGKWFFGRGKLVANLIATTPSDNFLIGDIGLRPTVWPVPRLMSLASWRGFKIIGGSDSLPLPGEERWIGKNGVQVTGSFNPLKPAASIRSILLNPDSIYTPLGKRCPLMAFVSRWGRNQLRPQE